MTDASNHNDVTIAPLPIGDVVCENNVVLAPMAGVGNHPFRILCKEQGAGLVCSELVSARALRQQNKKSHDMLKITKEESPVSLQIFGSGIEDVVYAACTVEQTGADIVDFNMGCPVPKVLKSGGGAALLCKPQMAQKLLKGIVKAVSIPVTVKMRSGWDSNSINAVEMAKACQDAGVSAVTVHGRTKAQMNKGEVDYDIIARVQSELEIAVIGNGDVFGPLQAEEMLQKTGCQGVMVGRGALGNPWIFREIVHYLKTKTFLPKPTTLEKVETMRKHLKMLVDLKGEKTACKEMRQHAQYYTKGVFNAAQYRNSIVGCSSVKDYEKIFCELEQLTK